MAAGNGWVRRTLKGLGWFLAALVVLALVGAAGVWFQLGRSLPQLDGDYLMTGLAAPVTVTRDALGVPTVTGTTRNDVARALGFLHAQDRFFQMDLSRRRAAGELSELFGPVALATDRSARLHRFRHRAKAVLAAGSPDERAALTAYAEGVNAGLNALSAAPFEYLLLRQTPKPWTPDDSILVVASMFFSLQDSTTGVEARAALLAEAFPTELAEFLNSTASDWDTPMEGDRIAAPVPPSASVFDLRTSSTTSSTAQSSPAQADLFASAMGIIPPDADARGSNNWVVAGSRTTDGRALLSDDMHLSLSVPNIWYRATLAWSDNRGAHQVTGVTLPGVPSAVVGSNGHIAWGFTNTTADWSDRVLLELVPGDPTRYLTPDGPRAFDITRERIVVDNEEDVWLEVRETIWGPVDAPDHAGRLFALVWVAHSPEGMNFRLSAMEGASTIEEAMDIANASGTPGQNCVIADAQGNIAWTIAGRIPRRVGFDGRLPTSWADGTRRWDGWYSSTDYPRLVNPPDGIIVTANNRIATGAHLAMLGDGGYDPGARARQILDGVRAVKSATEADMLAVQLDDRALLMERWRTLALEAIGDDTTPGRAEFRRLLKESWSGKASIDSVGYRLVRQFRLRVAELTFAPFVERLRVMDSTYPSTPGRSLEGAVWSLVTTQPPHLLNQEYKSWNSLLLGAVDDTVTSLTSGGRLLADRTWGEANTLMVQHPLSRAVPQLSEWLDMPRSPLPGDSHMPRVQGTTHGASERLTVSPGHESDGLFHMATGQSGHPRSKHYRDGHEAWATGAATPFLPGPAVHTLVLRPKRRG
jgi:penicillin amidase